MNSINECYFSINADVQKSDWYRRVYRKTLDDRLGRLKLFKRFKLSMKTEPKISAMTIDSKEKYMICGGSNGNVRIINLKNFESKKTEKSKRGSDFNENGMITNIQWCGIDSRLFLMGSGSDKLVLCETSKSQKLGNRKFDSSPIQFHWNQYHETNPMVAVSDRSNHAKIIDFRVSMNINQDIRWANRSICNVQWFPSGKHLLYCGDVAGNVALFDVRSGRKALLEKNVCKSPSTAIRLSSDGQRIILADSLNCIHILDSSNFKTLRTHQLPPPTRYNNIHPVNLEIFEESDLFVSIPCGRNIAIVRFPKYNSEPCQQILRGNMSNVMCTVFWKSRRQLFSGSQNSAIFLWAEDRIVDNMNSMLDEMK